MIAARLYKKHGQYTGFAVSGHADSYDENSEYDLVCASVSSAVYLVCNALTEGFGGCRAFQGESEITLEVDENSESIQLLLQGFAQHLREISAQYPQNLTLEETPHAQT